MSIQLTLDFLNDLASNNNKTWFDGQRSRYKLARAAFEESIAAIITAFRVVEDLGDLTPKDCMFRINRDVRFSNDKSPYNTSMSASIGRGGRRGEGRSYFLRVAPGDSFVGSGLFEPDKTALDNVRQHLARDAQPLRTITSAPAFTDTFGTITGDTLKTAPLGYDRNHPAIDVLRYKQFLAVHRFSDGDLVQQGFVDQFVAACIAMQPFLDYLDMAATAPPRD